MADDETSGADAPLIQTGAVDGEPRRWLKLIDQTRCIGCHACTTACKSENEVPLSVTRTYVKNVDVGTFPQARRAFQVTRCNQCEDAPCVAACPTSAMYTRPDGIVDFDKDACIGCKACMAACPYDAIFINPEDNSAEKCNLCSHRIDSGLEPACVVVCPTQAILVGQFDDPGSEAARMVAREPVAVRRPEKGTRPKLFYRGATQATLDPLAARRPDGDTFAWSEIQDGPGQVASGHPGTGNSSAAALLSYDIGHRMPWDWRVSLYTWTKGVAAGSYLVATLLAATGRLPWDGTLTAWAAPLLAAVFLALTAGLLIWDLEHPARFVYILTRPQWRSWLVRGGIILTGYAGALGLHLLAGPLGGGDAMRVAVAVPGVPLAVLAAVYTAYLFAQAKARDLWQNPLLPAHLLVQAGVAGAAALLPVAAWTQPDAVPPLGWTLAATAGAHALMAAGEVTLAHPTEHARLAVKAMTRGRYARPFWIGLALTTAGLAAPVAGAWVAPLALAGLVAYEHAYVQAGQSVPLA
ncbi:4Fe-4S dicluster domain-containing protein [Actinomadura formosensis]|uniref:4Fe-4S dicluster domain-containing protein n=1 Tax=Actinomadura formosensis TaxID=60706 RepID=UPI000834FB64|nr:4Fe-4S dicluster domain-containing protein [Actinomadura formosensis]